MAGEKVRVSYQGQNVFCTGTPASHMITAYAVIDGEDRDFLLGKGGFQSWDEAVRWVVDHRMKPGGRLVALES